MAVLSIAVAMLIALLGRPAYAAQDFAYVRSTADALNGSIVLDVRALDDCRKRSLAGARCLPANDFLGPHRRLPSPRDLLWLLGTAGLNGKEAVLVVGQDATARDFVAGLLYVAGQRHVQALSEPITRALESGAASEPGRERGMVREVVFEMPMRDEVLVLRDEITAMHPWPLLLDGRTESEYWGEVVRAARSGHLPGAISLPALQLRTTRDAAAQPRPALPQGVPIAYAHDAFEGLAYLTLLTAGHGVPARLYAEGWAQWAAHGALPADAVGYPDLAPGALTSGLPPLAAGPSLKLLFAAGAFVLAAFGIGRWTMRRRLA